MATHGARAADVLRRAWPAPFQAAAALDAESAPRLPVRTPVELIGRHPQRDGHVALGLALAFGQADAEALAQLAGLARDQGAGAMRSAPGRVLLVSVLMDHRAASFAAAAERLGFITRADDPRRRIAACPGKPGCSSGWIPARILAAELASHLPPNGRHIDVHVSGCAKGCAHPAAAALTVVGSASGCGIVRHGTARATPSRWVAPDELVAELVRAANEGAHG